MRRLPVLILIITLLVPFWSPRAAAADGPLPLSAYPRPPYDNGLGVHWTTLIYGQSPEVVDYFVGELSAMNVRWVKFLNDGTEGRQNDYLVDQLVSHGIMPVMRIYDRCNRALDLGALRRLVEHYRPKGVFYYELYNEPELSGVDGGWCNGERPNPERILDIWIPAARVVQEAGGFPSIPSIFPPSLQDPNWRNSFFIRFLQGLKDRGQMSILYRSWGAVHNYFLNHPVDYPSDTVNLTGAPLTSAEIAAAGLTQADVDVINQARARARRPRSEGDYYVGDSADDDPDCFFGFLAYHNRFREIFDFDIPLISTEGGVQVGSSEDPRYPKVTERLMADRTVQVYEYMLDQAPDYYFAFSSWLLAEKALGRFGSGWESWAWYKDRQGNYLPVVDRLKTHPRRTATRQATHRQTTESVAPTATPTATPASSFQLPASSFQYPASNLDRFPRPPADNGRGIHWIPTLFGQSTDVVDRFVAEVIGLNIKWVKLMQSDQPKVEHEYLIRSLVKAGIMPILRVYRPDNTPYEHLDALVRQAKPLGVSYFELYNEPNIAGTPGGWRAGEAISVERMVAVWVPAARTVIQAGGYPSVPAPAPGGDYEDMAFLRQFLRGVIAAGGKDVLTDSWIAMHNYFFNHPLDYPEDPVNLRSVSLSATEIAERGLSVAQVAAINQARAISRKPRAEGGYYVGDTIAEDSGGFRKFEAYEAIVQQEVGFAMPILSTEGGAIPGTQEDPRYPPVTDNNVARWTADAFSFMAQKAPAYYFTFTPWILANLAGGSADAQWEGAAWFPAGAAQPRPVVDAVRALASQPRVLTPSPVLSPAAATTTAPATDTILGWVIVWRDRQPLRCVPAIFSATNPLYASWNPPVDGSQWGMDVRNDSGIRIRSFGTVSGDGRVLPALCQSDDAQPTPTPTPTPASTPQPEQADNWDARLDALGVTVSRITPPQTGVYWRLVSAVYEDETEAAGRHHIFVRLLDERGQDVDGAVIIAWRSGQDQRTTQRNPGDNDPYAHFEVNFPMYGPVGSYRVAVEGLSDIVSGLGLPAKHHVNYLLTFQRTAAG